MEICIELYREKVERKSLDLKKLSRKAERKSDKNVKNRNELGQPDHQVSIYEWRFRGSIQGLIREVIMWPGQARAGFENDV